jgi:hypothetical protein
MYYPVMCYRYFGQFINYTVFLTFTFLVTTSAHAQKNNPANTFFSKETGEYGIMLKQLEGMLMNVQHPPGYC